MKEVILVWLGVLLGIPLVLVYIRILFLIIEWLGSIKL